MITWKIPQVLYLPQLIAAAVLEALGEGTYFALWVSGIWSWCRVLLRSQLCCLFGSALPGCLLLCFYFAFPPQLVCYFCWAWCILWWFARSLVLGEKHLCISCRVFKLRLERHRTNSSFCCRPRGVGLRPVCEVVWSRSPSLKLDSLKCQQLPLGVAFIFQST